MLKIDFKIIKPILLILTTLLLVILGSFITFSIIKLSTYDISNSQRWVRLGSVEDGLIFGEVNVIVMEIREKDNYIELISNITGTDENVTILISKEKCFENELCITYTNRNSKSSETLNLSSTELQDFISSNRYLSARVLIKTEGINPLNNCLLNQSLESECIAYELFFDNISKGTNINKVYFTSGIKNVYDYESE
jgi:hypothetical protein